MLEKWIGKKVKIFLMLDEQQLVYTGKIIKEYETHFDFIDKYNKPLLLNKDDLKQVKEVPE